MLNIYNVLLKENDRLIEQLNAKAQNEKNKNIKRTYKTIMLLLDVLHLQRTEITVCNVNNTKLQRAKETLFEELKSYQMKRTAKSFYSTIRANASHKEFGIVNRSTQDMKRFYSTAKLNEVNNSINSSTTDVNVTKDDNEDKKVKKKRKKYKIGDTLNPKGKIMLMNNNNNSNNNSKSTASNGGENNNKKMNVGGTTNVMNVSTVKSNIKTYSSNQRINNSLNRLQYNYDNLMAIAIHGAKAYDPKQK